MEKSRFFSVMVVGENHEDIISKYDMNREVEPHIKYEYLKADKYKSTSIKLLENILANKDKLMLGEEFEIHIKQRLDRLNSISAFEYYRELTAGMYYDDNGNAMSDVNDDGHYETARIGRNFAIPLKLKDGSESLSAKKSDIDWDAMHLANKKVYEAAWDICINGREPENEEEETIKTAMGERKAYFSNFKTRDEYVEYSTSYWNYAYVDKDGWVDMSSNFDTDMNWVRNFYDRFVSKLKDDDLITIYECSVKEP